MPFVTPSLYEGQAFFVFGAFIYTRLTWVFLLMVPQVLNVTLMSLCAHDVASIPHGEVHDTLF